MTARLMCADGSEYTGQIDVNGMQDGKGVAIWPDGTMFEGLWDQSKYVYGRVIWPGGNSYTGHFQDRRMHGRGVYRWLNGEKFDGEWAHHRRLDGDGEMLYANGNIYKGKFKNEKRHGQGEQTW